MLWMSENHVNIILFFLVTEKIFCFWKIDQILTFPTALLHRKIYSGNRNTHSTLVMLIISQGSNFVAVLWAIMSKTYCDSFTERNIHFQLIYIDYIYTLTFKHTNGRWYDMIQYVTKLNIINTFSHSGDFVESEWFYFVLQWVTGLQLEAIDTFSFL